MESLSQQDLPLDDVKEFIYVALRSQERFSTALKALLESLDKKQDGQDEWLELVQEEMEKGVTFCNNQLNIWRDFSNRTNEYITFVRNEADILAIEDLQIEKKVATGSRVKTIHPELAKFKLEKQARILGKYGGVPAFGTGMMMQLPPRDKILQATASPAAREIQYSKVEGKDAQNLAQVMQFKAKLVNKQRGAAGSSASTSTPNDEESREAVTLMGEDAASAASPWQAETIGRKGKEYFRQQEGPQDPPTSLGGGASSPFNNELADKLKARQGVLAEAEAQALALIKQGGQHDPSGPPVIAANASAELSDKLKRQQQALKVCDEAKDISLVSQHTTAAGSTSNVIGTTHPVWSNPASSFGAELAGALQRRAVAASTAADGTGCSNRTPIRHDDAAAVMTPSSSHSLAAGEGAGGLNYRGTPTPFSLGTPGGSSSGTPAPGSELAEIMRQRQARAAAAGTAQFSSQQ